LAALLATLLAAAQPASASASPHGDAAQALMDGSKWAKQVHHTSRRPRHAASLEEFFEIDDDAEQYFKPSLLLFQETAGFPLVVESQTFLDLAVRRSHRACAPYPTGPPHA
jgi:hypothetical protein